jgi:toxin ParE1/3/4
MREIYEAIRSLNRFPFRGRSSAERDVRVMALPSLPYLVYYRLKEQTIEVLYIRHGAQNSPF